MPLYDNFNIQLSVKELEELKRLWRRYGVINRTCGPVSQSLVRAGLLEWNDYRQGYEFTHIGKIPVGELSLMLFNQIQSPLILEKLATFDLSATQTT